MDLDFLRLGDKGARCVVVLPLVLFGDDVVAELDTFIADVDRRAGDELSHLSLRLPAEAA